MNGLAYFLVAIQLVLCILTVWAAERLFARAPGLPERTACLAVSLAAVWCGIPLLLELLLWILEQLPLLLLAVVGLWALWGVFHALLR